MNWLILSFITILFWGLGGYLGKFAGNSGSGFQVYFFEALGTISFAVVYFTFFNPSIAKTALTNFDWHVAIPALGMGILWGIATWTFILALNQGRASIIVPLTAVYPVVTVILAIIFLREAISIKEIFGILLTIGGIVLLSSGGK
ncbi:MAG: EamA family transporter [bacterium]|nr:EamA family transporter [bacterium]